MTACAMPPTMPSAPLVPPRKVSHIQFHNNTRFVVMTFALLALVFVQANNMFFNLSIICMTEEMLDHNGTMHTVDIFTASEKAWLYSIVAVGTLITTMIVMKLIGWIGGRLTFFIFGLCTGIGTLLFPLAVQMGVSVAMVMRFLQGIGQGMSFVGIGYVGCAWSPAKTSGIFLTALTSYNQFAPLMTMPSAGFFCTSRFGWQGGYIFQGALTLIVFVVFFIIYTDAPRSHRHVSDKELAYIEGVELDRRVDGAPKFVPYRDILSDFTIIGTIIMAIGDLCSFYIFILFAPVYLNKVVGLDVEQTGIIAAMPHALGLVIKVACGQMSDRITFLRQVTMIRLFSCFSQFSMIFAFITLALLPPGWPVMAQIIYVGALSGTSTSSVGFYKAISLSCGRFAPTVMSWLSVIYSVVLLALPFIKTAVAGDDDPAQWRMLFFMAAGFAFVTLAVFLFAVTDQLRPWARSKESQVHVHPVWITDESGVGHKISM